MSKIILVILALITLANASSFALNIQERKQAAVLRAPIKAAYEKALTVGEKNALQKKWEATFLEFRSRVLSKRKALSKKSNTLDATLAKKLMSMKNTWSVKFKNALTATEKNALQARWNAIVDAEKAHALARRKTVLASKKNTLSKKVLSTKNTLDATLAKKLLGMKGAWTQRFKDANTLAEKNALQARWNAIVDAEKAHALARRKTVLASKKNTLSKKIQSRKIQTRGSNALDATLAKKLLAMKGTYVQRFKTANTLEEKNALQKKWNALVDHENALFKKNTLSKKVLSKKKVLSAKSKSIHPTLAKKLLQMKGAFVLKYKNALTVTEKNVLQKKWNALVDRETVLFQNTLEKKTNALSKKVQSKKKVLSAKANSIHPTLAKKLLSMKGAYSLKYKNALTVTEKNLLQKKWNALVDHETAAFKARALSHKNSLSRKVQSTKTLSKTLANKLLGMKKSWTLRYKAATTQAEKNALQKNWNAVVDAEQANTLTKKGNTMSVKGNVLSKTLAKKLLSMKHAWVQRFKTANTLEEKNALQKKWNSIVDEQQTLSKKF